MMQHQHHQQQQQQRWWSLIPTFTAKLVLEVFGAAGAIWGFSEALGIRTEDTVGFWRPAALFVGFLFGIRWIVQMVDACSSLNNNHTHHAHPVVDVEVGYPMNMDQHCLTPRTLFSADEHEALLFSTTTSKQQLPIRRYDSAGHFFQSPQKGAPLSPQITSSPSGSSDDEQI
ncbi:expressed unknown protein [Seminavis robusta]|uniref:Uncharacterized protein n=1 Tax=Seminavis robusta TaxID=568900 RepID=A0A9N8H9J1_9STRA|nr:expressed unknown protein [Seminavis robusta]|eukprot:Sro119_g058000.1 n/a (172) ;mRNA; r:38883-39398